MVVDCGPYCPQFSLDAVRFSDVLRIHEPLVECSALELKFSNDVLGGIHGWEPPPEGAMRDKWWKDATAFPQRSYVLSRAI